MKDSSAIVTLALVVLLGASRAFGVVGPDTFYGKFIGNGGALTNLQYVSTARDATNAWAATNAHALGQVPAAEWAMATQGVVRSSWAYVAATATNSYYVSNNYVLASAYLSNGYAAANWHAPPGSMTLPSTAVSELSASGTSGWATASVTNGPVYWRLRTSYYGADGWVSNIWAASWRAPWLVGVSNDLASQELLVDTPTVTRGVANKSYVDGAVAGVTPAAWADYVAIADVRLPGKRLTFDDYSLLSNGTLYALTYTVESSQQWFRIQHSGQDLFRLSASNSFLCITNLKVDVSNWVNLAVATNWMETSPFPEVTTNLMGYWSTVGTFLSVTNADSSVTLRFTNDWTGMAFFRAVCVSTNPSLTEIRTDQTYLTGSLTVDGAGGNVLTNGGVTINGSALGNGTNLTITAALPAGVVTNGGSGYSFGVVDASQTNHPVTLQQLLRASEGGTTYYLRGASNATSRNLLAATTDRPTTNWNFTYSGITTDAYLGPGWLVMGTGLLSNIKAGNIVISGVSYSKTPVGSCEVEWEAYITNVVAGGAEPEWSDAGPHLPLSTLADWMPLTIQVAAPTNLTSEEAVHIRPKLNGVRGTVAVTLTGGSNGLSSVVIPTGLSVNTIASGASEAALAAVSNVAWWASNFVAGVSNVAWWASNSVASVSNMAKWASNSVASVSNVACWASNSLSLVSNTAWWASNSFTVASNRIYAGVTNAQPGAVLPNLLRGTGTNYLYGVTNGLTVGDMLRFDGTNLVRGAGFVPRNGGFDQAGGAWDYETNNLPTNGVVYYLDLSLLTNADGSAAVPSGAKWVLTSVQALGPTLNNFVKIMSVSNATQVANIARIQVASQTFDSYAPVAILTDRVLYMQMSAAANWVRTRIKILGCGY